MQTKDTYNQLFNEIYPLIILIESLNLGWSHRITIVTEYAYLNYIKYNYITFVSNIVHYEN